MITSLPPIVLSIFFSILISSQYRGCHSMNSLKINSKPCKNAIGEEGTCLFAWECIQSEGERLGTCSDGFLFGMCCGLKTKNSPLMKNSSVSSNPPRSVRITESSTASTTSTSISKSSEPVTTLKIKVTGDPEVSTFGRRVTLRPRPSSPVTHIVSSSSTPPLLKSITGPTNLVEIPTSTSSPISSSSSHPPLNSFDGILISSLVSTTVNAGSSNPLILPLSTSVLPTTPSSADTENDVFETVAEDNDVTTEGSSDKFITVTAPSTQNLLTEATTRIPIETMDGTELTNLIQILTTMNSVTSTASQNKGQDKRPSMSDDFVGTTMSPLNVNSSLPVQADISEPVDNNTIPSHVINQITQFATEVTSTRPYINKLDCGHRPLKPQARVVGGRNAFFGEWPWQVLIKEATWLGLFVKTKCGGVLIDHKWVLTAAHCQPGFLGSLVVIVGEYDLTGDFENLKPVAKPVRRMIVHRNYKPDTFENDIALLELESAFEIQPHVIPICLPDADDTDDYVGLVAHVAGWGGPVPSILQVVKLPIIPNNQCQKMFQISGHHKIIRNTFICAGFTDGGKDSCEGDSGGPLMVQKDGRWTLIGTVSHGIKCAEPNLPGVYMRTSTYMPWVSSIIRRHYD